MLLLHEAVIKGMAEGGIFPLSAKFVLCMYSFYISSSQNR